MAKKYVSPEATIVLFEVSSFLMYSDESGGGWGEDDDRLPDTPVPFNIWV